MKTNKITAVPKLRFPEFNGDWKIFYLNNISHNLDSKRVPITSKDRKKGNIPYYGASGIIDYIDEFIFDDNLLCISEDGANLIDRVYPIAFSVTGKTWINNHAHVLKFENLWTQVTVENYLNHISLEKHLTGVAQPKLNKAKLNSIEIPLPKLKEQQKIADCLSSLDMLIKTEMEQLDTLKEYKAGLLQQLFPAEGETTPKHRFAEFEGDGDWEEMKLGDICHTYSGGTPNTSNKEFYKGSIPFIRSAEINKNQTELYINNNAVENSSAKYVQKGDILFALYGANSGEVAISKLSGVINQAILCIKSEHSHDFIFQNLSYRKSWIINTYIQGGQGNLSGAIVKSIPISLPELLEQQKIANSLSSLDNLIQAKDEKIKTLKEHKQGLMQQLFPTMEE